MKFEPNDRDKGLVYKYLPSEKEHLIENIKSDTGFSEKWIRSLIWNMRRIGAIWTDSQGMIQKT